MEHTQDSLTVELIKNCTDLTAFEIISGGMTSAPTWEEYIGDYTITFQPRLTLIKDYIVSNKLVGTTGEQQNNWAFKFSDGLRIGFTWRAWGDLMQAIVNKKEGYAAYYM